MIRNQIEDVVKQLTAPVGFNAPTFEYGTAAELNVILDSAEFPVVMLFALNPVTKQQTLSNAVNEKFSIYLEFLFKTEFDQYTRDNEIYIDLANNMCNEFLVKLGHYRETPNAARYFKIKVNDNAKSQPVYNKGDSNSTGVNLSLNLETMLNTNITLS